MMSKHQQSHMSHRTHAALLNGSRPSLPRCDQGNPQRHAAAASADQAPSSSANAHDAQLSTTYDALAALITPPGDPSEGLLTAGPTPLGRGLIACRAAAQGDALLSVEAWNTLCVTDDMGGRGGSAFGAAVLRDWQVVHGQLPPLLDSYLASGGPLCWGQRVSYDHCPTWGMTDMTGVLCMKHRPMGREGCSSLVVGSCTRTHTAMSCNAHLLRWADGWCGCVRHSKLHTGRCAHGMCKARQHGRLIR